MSSLREIEIEDVNKVCRLCLGTEKLIWIFDNRIDIPQNLEEVIEVATGVTMTRTDNVSQKLCEKCLNITVRMFKFRTSSIANDQRLKERAAVENNVQTHKSVKKLIENYPKLKLPTSITKCDIEPVIELDNKMVNLRIEEENKKRMRKKRSRSVYSEKPSPFLTEMEDLEEQITTHVIPQDTSERGSEVAKNKSTIEEMGTTSNRTDSSENKTKKKRKMTTSPSRPKKLRTEDENSLVTLKYVTKSLFICDICNSILYSAKDLKKHKIKHMRCKLCKLRFDSIEETQKHSDNSCEIKKIMTRLPTVKVMRCDKIKEIRLKYGSAFGLESPTESKKDDVSPMETTTSTSSNSNIEQQKEGASKVDQSKSPTQEAAQSDCNEISLISDDEESSITTIIPKTKIKPQEEPSASSMIKPSIGIIGENVLDVDFDDNEVSLLKNLLQRTGKAIRDKKKDSCAQTDLPTNADIRISLSKDRLFEIVNARRYLNFYKIPVNISNATNYSVKFSYESSPSVKKNRHWSVLNNKKTTKSTSQVVDLSSETKAVNPAKFSQPEPAMSSNRNQGSSTSTLEHATTPTFSNNVVTSSNFNNNNMASCSRTLAGVGVTSSLRHLRIIRPVSSNNTVLPPPPIPNRFRLPLLSNNINNYASSSGQQFPNENARLLNGIVGQQTINPTGFLLMKSGNSNSFRFVPTTNTATNDVQASTISMSSNQQNIMPPPLNTFVPHRTVVKPMNFNINNNNMQNQQLENSARTTNSGQRSSVITNVPTTNNNSTFVPMLRVRNLQELT